MACLLRVGFFFHFRVFKDKGMDIFTGYNSCMCNCVCEKKFVYVKKILLEEGFHFPVAILISQLRQLTMYIYIYASAFAFVSHASVIKIN